MDNFQLDAEASNAILKKVALTAAAEIFEASTQALPSIRVVTLALDTAQSKNQPLEIQFPFKSVLVKSATDQNTSVSMRVDSKNDGDLDIFDLNSGESYAWDKKKSRAFLHWSAQPSKTITLYFGVDVEIRSGKITTVSSGGVTISEGSASAISTVALVAATAAIVAVASAARKVSSLYNDTGSVLYVGPDNTVTDVTGFPVQPGSYFRWLNSAALYGYSVLGGNVKVLEES